MQRRPIRSAEDERETSSVDERKVDEDWRQRCEWCGTLLPGTATFRKRFCNSRCKERDYHALIERERAAARAKLKCQRCGKPIEDARRKDRKYCSKICNGRADYRRNAESYCARKRARYRVARPTRLSAANATTS